MGRLVIISNRLPVTYKDGTWTPSAGGLATGLGSLEGERLWIGWPGATFSGAEQRTVTDELAALSLVPVFLDDKLYDNFYTGFSNKTLWPLFHYHQQFVEARDEYWTAYEAANRAFADAVCAQLAPDDTVWVHDYQLMLLPALIRERFPDISIGFFLHIPFPSYEIYRTLPWRDQLLRGVLGADQIGFHEFNYMRHFLSATYRICGHEHEFGRLRIGHRLVSVDVFPMGIDYDKYAKGADSESSDESDLQLQRLAGDRKVILSVDRLDYSKGIVNRVLSFERFLEQHAEYRGKVTYLMVVVPSRLSVDQYRALKHELDEQLGRINSKFATFDWQPIQYMYRSLGFKELMAAYRRADVALITPMRDGMNLVAKEFVAAKEQKKRGVLILSEMAGSASELLDALIVNPSDERAIVEALVTALTMDEAEQESRLVKMQERLRTYTVQWWASTFISDMRKLHTEQHSTNTKLLIGERRESMLSAYRKAKRRLIVLDYDGTMMPFASDPQAVSPDETVRKIMSQFTADPRNLVVVSSGRDRQTLEKWLGDFKIDISAEHGIWTRRGGEWRSATLRSDWMPEVRALLDRLVARTPGSHIESKACSLAWHYRALDKALGEKRVREFRDVLLYLCSNQDLQILEGNKVVEVKNSGVNKGVALGRWLDGAENETPFDFLMAIGDDTTDEDMHRRLASQAHSFTVKVGADKLTDAKFSLRSVDESRAFLLELSAQKGE